MFLLSRRDCEHKRRLKLTEPGQLLYRRAKEILSLTEKTQSEIHSMGEGMRGTISTRPLSPDAWSGSAYIPGQLIYRDVQDMVQVLDTLSGTDYFGDSEVIRDRLLPEMSKLRSDSDAAEMLTSKKYWPLPNYGLLMFGEK